jgi:hypothetical protein
MVIWSLRRWDDFFGLTCVCYRLLEGHRAYLVSRCGPCLLLQPLAGGFRHALVELRVHLGVKTSRLRGYSR